MNAPDGRLHIGAAWYPEHWPEERWPEDVRLMADAGFTVVRMAEFAWSVIQPSRDELELGWLERAVDLAASSGIQAVLGTPTAAPPAWLVEAHPDLLALDETGRRVQFGNRCHYCVTSPDLHEAAEVIAAALAERFGRHPAVIGWQIDNEYNRVCYCDRCADAFRRFLADRYGTLDALNARWSTRYWSQTYTDWSQIPIPIGPHNPGLMLAFRRFVTDAYRRFQQLQVIALRRHVPKSAWITHNFMHWYGGYDHYALSDDLDLASWDWYVESGHTDYLSSGAAHDLVRGFKRRTFWLMETQPGTVNWQPINASLRPGEARSMAWQAVAHGADAVLYWQWRSALGGQEQFHGALLDSSGRPRPVLDDVRQLGREFQAASSVLAGSTVPRSPVAFLHSYPSRWSLEAQRHHHAFDYVEHLVQYYRPFARRNVAVDIVSPNASLEGYVLAVAPALTIVEPDQVAKLRSFVERGGHLILTIRTGVKDAENALLPTRSPGELAEVAGVEVEEFYALLEPVGIEGDGLGGQASVWAERLGILDEQSVRILARFDDGDGWLAGRPAITARSFGTGRIYYVAAYLDEAAQQVLTDLVLATARIAPSLEVPADVEVRIRVSADGDEVYVLVNHGPEPRMIGLPWVADDRVTGAVASGTLELPGHGSAVLVKSPSAEGVPGTTT